MICREPNNSDVIQLSYHILSMTRSLKELDNRCNILKKSFTTPGIMQLIEPIVIVHTPSLFDLLKAIGAAFIVNLCGLDIGW